MASCCLKGTLPTQYITQKNALLSQIDTCTHTFMGLLVIYKLGIESSDKSLFICAYIYIYILHYLFDIYRHPINKDVATNALVPFFP